jgi:ABC-type antimicrobial peptide transport system permease subunit
MQLLKITLRMIAHYRMFSLINVAGLTLSLTCAVIISRYVYSELTVDGFNRNLDRIFITTTEDSNNPNRVRYAGISNPNNEKAFVDLSEHAGVDKHSVFYFMPDADIVAGEQTYNTKLLVADTVFMQILDFPVTAGAANVYRPEDVLLTETFARKLFGDENPIGKTLIYPSVNATLTVAGLIGAPSSKSVITFDMIASSQLSKHWPRISYSLILLHPHTDWRAINKQYDTFMDMSLWGYAIRYQLSPYKDIYFNSSILDFGDFPHGRHIYVLILSGVGVLLLLIGLVNYVNIYTVVILRRNRELGMKKIFGAEGYRIFAQLIVENLTLVLVALALAFALAGTLHTFVENTLEITQFPSLRFDLWLSLAIACAIPVIVSIAPFLRYQYFSPLRSLQSLAARTGRPAFSRQFFLCFQFFITMTMIVVSLFFVKQLHFMLHKDAGYRTKDIIKVSFLKEDYMWMYERSQEKLQEMRKRKEEVADELRQKLDASTLLENWTWGETPHAKNRSGFEFRAPGGELKKTVLMGADESWFRFFDIQLLYGRLWDNSVDNTFSYVAIVNEAALREFGITDYREGILEPHRRLWYVYNREEEMKTNPPYRIVGVVKDFHTAHLSQPLSPVVFYFSQPSKSSPVIASFAPGRRQEVIAFMKNLHEELVGGEFTYTFVEDEIAALYREDRKIALIYSLFTGVAILVAMLGLVGMSLFDIRQRRREIAIRKVNGALLKDVIRILLKKYFILLAVAFALSVPVAWYAISRYAEQFAYRTSLSWWLFAVALAAVALISLLTLISQARKAGNENPAGVLMSE